MDLGPLSEKAISSGAFRGLGAALALLLAAGAPPKAETAAQPPQPGEVLFRDYCARCHLGQVPKAPHKMFLEMMAPDAIYDSLNVGAMRKESEKLTREQKRLVSTYLAGDHPVDTRRAPRCTGRTAMFDTYRQPAASGWGITPDSTRYIDAKTAGLTATYLPRLELKWAFAFPNAQRIRSQPAIAYGAVYIGSQDGTVYALDEESGCVRWTFRAPAEVRTAIVVEPTSAALAREGTPLVYFGDLIAHVFAVDAFTGQLRWTYKADDHPNATVTAAPTLYEGTLYVPISSLEVTSAADPAYECCTFRGAVLALDATSGKPRWKSHTIIGAPKEVGRTRVGTRIIAPSGAPVWNSPTIDAKRGVLYVGSGENYSSPPTDTSDAIIAFRLTDGEMVWHAQKTSGDAWNVACMLPDNPNCPAENGPDVDFGAATIMFRDPAGRDLLDTFGGSLQHPSEESWNKFTPKIALTYQFDPELMVYALYSEGYRAGGFSGRANTYEAMVTPYDPETVDNYELGMKSQWLDNRLRFNATAFYMEYNDKQEEQSYPIEGGTGQQTLILNASTAELYGVELELLAAPMEGLTISATLGTLEAKYKDFKDPVTGANLDNLDLRRAPKLTSNLEPVYTWNALGGQMTARAAWHYVSEMGLSFFNTPQTSNSAQNIIDASLSYQHENTMVTLWGTNLTDEDSYTVGFDVGANPTADPPAPGFWSYTATRPPRLYGLQISQKF
jgi:outer membrane protein assembly factor BamB/mono/diheme cytochrome c family protein